MWSWHGRHLSENVDQSSFKVPGGRRTRFPGLVRPAALTLLVGLGVVLAHRTPSAPAPEAHVHPVAPVMVAGEVPAAVPVDRAGWTLTTGTNALPAGRTAGAVDGDPETFLRSAADRRFTIDLHGQVRVAGVSYLPRPGSTGDGNIGRYQVELSTDGHTWGAPVSTGTFADDATLKVAEFTAAPARYVRLTAINEADGGTGAVSAAELNVLAAVDPTLPRTGWTVTADSAASGNPAANVLDGNTATYWHTVWGTGAPALPHNLVIDMKANKTVSGLTYLPRQDTSNNGNIGNYRVELSTTGTSWGTPVATGTFADTKAVKTVTFTAATARYVRLTALTEAGGRGVWSSGSEINILGPGGTPTPVRGQWGATIGFPLVPGSAAVLPNGKVLTWSANAAMSFGGSGQTVTATYTPSAGTVTQRTVTNTGHDMFCPGISYLADGRILVSGGDDAGKSSLYTSGTDAWTTGPAMAITRAYQSTATLSDGRVFAIGGSWRGGKGGKDGEIWSPTTGWTKLAGAPVAPMLTADVAGVYRSDNHAWLFGWSGGRVLQAGPSKAMNWYGTTGTGSVTAAGTRAADPDAMNGTAVMYDTGKILTLGGSPNYENTAATTNAHVITISGTSTVTTRKVASMAYARAYHNSVVLPDGKVFVHGGQAMPKPFSDTTAALSPELWDPATETFTTMAASAVPRTYHSVALLLPDGRVFVGGGGMCGTCTTNHPNGEIFTPPNLLNADGTLAARPSITSAPTTAAHGTNITVATDRAVSRFALVRMGTATHTVNTDQRRISLASTATAGGYTVSIPADQGVALPGYYMLFALDANGVPSVSRTIRLG